MARVWNRRSTGPNFEGAILFVVFDHCFVFAEVPAKLAQIGFALDELLCPPVDFLVVEDALACNGVDTALTVVIDFEEPCLVELRDVPGCNYGVIACIRTILGTKHVFHRSLYSHVAHLHYTLVRVFVRAICYLVRV